VLVEGVDRHAAGDDLKRQRLRSGASAAFVLAGEDQLDLLRSADVEIIGHQRFEEAWRGASETSVREISIWRMDSSHQ
jgi:hypothetical protein